MKKTIISNGFFALLLILSVNTFGQATYNSPYSRFGVGDLSGNNNPVISGMGGITAAFRDIAIVNHQNPASYTAFDTLSFVVNGGVSQRLSTWKSQTLSAQTEHSSLGYIRLGFPVTSRLKVSIGLNPYSNIGFNITSPQSLPDIGNFEYIYDGTGGLNSFTVALDLNQPKAFRWALIFPICGGIWNIIIIQPFLILPITGQQKNQNTLTLAMCG